MTGIIKNTASIAVTAALTFLSQGEGAVPRPLVDKLGESVSVRDFGAGKGGDDAAKVEAADAWAKMAGKAVYFPPGVYLFSRPVTATTSWHGKQAGVSILRYTGAANVDLVTATGIDGIVFRDLVIDGNASADPAQWTAANHDAFTGASGLSIELCDGARVERVHGRNNWRHAVRLRRCTNADLVGCTAKRNRGNFGDGFILISCAYVRFIGCTARDFTRIGFVADHYGTDPGTCHHILFAGCRAENGHDCSILVGGGEYNAGLWAENAAHVTVTDFTGTRLGQAQGRGVVLASGVKNNGVQGDVASFIVSGLRLEDVGVGLVALSMEDFPVSVMVSDYQAVKVWQGTSFQANTVGDNFKCTHAHVDVDMSLNGHAVMTFGFYVKPGLASRPRVEFSDCLIRHTNKSLARLQAYAQDGSVADICNYAFDAAHGGAELVVRNVANVDGGPVWFGFGYNHQNRVTVSDTHLFGNAVWLGAGSVDLVNCRVAGGQFGNGSAAGFTARECTIKGHTSVGGALVRIKGGELQTPSNEYLWMLAHGAHLGKPAVIVDDLYVAKTFTAGVPAMRLGSGAANFTAIMSNIIWYTEGANVAGSVAVLTADNVQTRYRECTKDTWIEWGMQNDSGVKSGIPDGVIFGAFH